LLPRSGLERSDFVLWHKTDVDPAIIDVCYWGIQQTLRLRPPRSEFDAVDGSSTGT
jgi:hypothetical protein